MTYVTVNGILNYGGFEGIDFKSDGDEMGDDQFQDYLENFVIPAVDGFINRYCNVKSFELISEDDAIVELRRGRGATDDEYSSVHLINREEDRKYLFREYPVASVLKVEIDEAGITGIPSWTELTERSDDDAGSYVVVEQFGLKFLYFTRNLPLEGYNTLRLTYTTGYAEGSDELSAIRLAATRLAVNILIHKKKIQEATTIRAYGVKDYAQLFDAFMESRLLTEEVKHILDRFRRPIVNTRLYE